MDRMTQGSGQPLVGITMGDAAGIGPEIIAKALADEEVFRACRPLVIGEPATFRCILRLLGSTLELHPVTEPAQGRFSPGVLDLLVVDSAPSADAIEFGRIQAAAGRAAFECIRVSAELALAGKIDAVATAPINKEAIRAAGIAFPGHTEIYAHLVGADHPLTMFALGKLRVFFLTRHMSLADAVRAVTADRVAQAIQQIHEALRSLGIARPSIAVCALNPHSGEGGMFGNEEIREIAPAIERSRARGVDALGPISADSIFYLGRDGRWDAILSLYHDQGHIPTKTLDFERTVSVTLGLPFMRTSVDHGTAFDIAGRGVASAVSMVEAIRVAAAYARARAGAGAGAHASPDPRN